MLTTGTDILYLARVQEAIAKHGDRFLQRIYTAQELAYCNGRIAALAARFAAKEAISKALGVGMRIMSADGISWHDAEVINDRYGKPTVRLHGKAQALAHTQGLMHWSLSLSHERDICVAFVVAV